MTTKIWVNQKAVAWALDDAPCPHNLVATLVALARRAHTADGRGAHPLASTLAANVGKSVVTVRNELVELRRLGLITFGDQSMVVDRYPPGQRPFVYDLAMHMKGPKPIGTSKNKSGKKSVLDDGAPSLEAGCSALAEDGQTGQILGGTHSLEAGCTHSFQAESTPSLEAVHKKTLNKTLKKDAAALSRSDPDSLDEPVDAEPETERDAASSFQDSDQEDQKRYAMQRDYLTRNGVTDPTELHVLPCLIEEMNNVQNPRGWWAHVDENRTIVDCIEDARNELDLARSANGGSGAIAKADWCGQCDDALTRQVEQADDRGNVKQYACPRCHPKKVAYGGVPLAADDFARYVHEQPQCEHGIRGGHIVHPPSGWTACPRQREATPRTGHDGRRVATERELSEGWQTQVYRNPVDDSAYDDWLARTPPGKKKRGYDGPYRDPDPHKYHRDFDGKLLPQYADDAE